MNMNNQNMNVKRNMPCNQSGKCKMQDMRNNGNNMGYRKEFEMDRDRRPVPDRRKLMKEIYELGFALVETVLYLDTHPADADALNYYHQIKRRYQMVMEMYSKEYGPLLNSNVMNENYWSWVATPMPWEVEDC